MPTLVSYEETLECHWGHFPSSRGLRVVLFDARTPTSLLDVHARGRIIDCGLVGRRSERAFRRIGTRYRALDGIEQAQQILGHVESKPARSAWLGRWLGQLARHRHEIREGLNLSQ